MSTNQHLADVLTGQSEVNVAVVQALGAIALQADKYDEQIANLVTAIDSLVTASAALRERVERLERISSQ
jgi:hypothetical protein